MCLLFIHIFYMDSNRKGQEHLIYYYCVFYEIFLFALFVCVFSSVECISALNMMEVNKGMTRKK